MMPTIRNTKGFTLIEIAVVLIIVGFLVGFGASLVGICELDRRWLYAPAYLITPEGGKVVENNISDDFKYAIAIAVEMDYEAISCSPAHPATSANSLRIAAGKSARGSSCNSWHRMMNRYSESVLPRTLAMLSGDRNRNISGNARA